MAAHEPLLTRSVMKWFALALFGLMTLAWSLRVKVLSDLRYTTQQAAATEARTEIRKAIVDRKDAVSAQRLEAVTAQVDAMVPQVAKAQEVPSTGTLKELEALRNEIHEFRAEVQAMSRTRQAQIERLRREVIDNRVWISKLQGWRPRG